MAADFWFLHQREGGEETWHLAPASDRDKITREVKPRFVTVLDLTTIPADGDWSKTKYRGPLYFDFDAEGDIELACQQFTAFLAKLNTKYDFDLSQARLYLSGGKGMHIEVPAECFMVKVPEGGTSWLPYIYKSMADALVVDTMDLRVYTGRRGRMWRTPNVQRESGKYKVQISLGEALEITPERYDELTSIPSGAIPTTPPSCNANLAMLFNSSRDSVVTHMRGRKKRIEKANKFLDPWKASGKTPPTIEKLMTGEIVAPGIGFNKIAMQLAIYATSVGWSLEQFLEKTTGLCESYTGDSSRYGSVGKRRDQLADQFRYMDENAMYEFDTAPIIKLVKKGVAVTDLGVKSTGDEAKVPREREDGEEADEESDEDKATAESLNGLRKGFIMNADGMWRTTKDGYEAICRANLINIKAYKDAESKSFKGYEFDIKVKGRAPFKGLLEAAAFVSSAKIKLFFAAYQLSFQGTDVDTMGLLDVMESRTTGSATVYSYPREGFFIMDNPHKDHPDPVKVYLTQNVFQTSVDINDPHYFKLVYRPGLAISSYNIDVDKAPYLNDNYIQALNDMFNFTRAEVAADMLGWMVACHYRSIYLMLFKQFPLLQVYGEAGSGKSQTVWMLSHMHWFMNDISVKSALGCTPFAMDCHASTSTSAPFILDEFKPRAMRKDRLDKAKDVFKASYIGGDIGERGTINRGAESNLAVIKSRATAPIVFMAEAIELETAIIERSVQVSLSKSYQTRQRKAAFDRLHSDPSVFSGLGRDIVELGFSIDLEVMREEVMNIVTEVEAGLPDYEDDVNKRPAPRTIYNRAVIVHGLRILKQVLQMRFQDRFDIEVDRLIDVKLTQATSEETKAMAVLGMSEMSKVLSRMAIMSRDEGAPWELRSGKDYLIGEGWIELRVERAYDAYRRFCATINDQPLFDNLEALAFGLNSYSPVTDRLCAGSDLRGDGSNERIVRLDIRKLNREGVNSFKN